MNKLLDFTQFLNEEEIAKDTSDASTMPPQLFAANFGITIDQLREQNKKGSTEGFREIWDAMYNMIEYDNGRMNHWDIGKKYGFKIPSTMYGVKLDTFIKNFFKKIYVKWEDENWKNYCNNREIFKLAMTWFVIDENMFQICSFVNLKSAARIKMMKNFTEKPKRQNLPYRVHKDVIAAGMEDKAFKSIFETYEEIKKALSDDVKLVKLWVFSGLSFDEFIEEKKGRLASKKFGF